MELRESAERAVQDRLIVGNLVKSVVRYIVTLSNPGAQIALRDLKVRALRLREVQSPSIAHAAVLRTEPAAAAVPDAKIADGERRRQQGI